MDGEQVDGTVHLPAGARERFYDSRGYGRPDGDALDVAPVEAAHLLYRGDLDSVDGMDFRGFLAANADLAVRFLVYKDLRDRGFYLSPARDGWVDDPTGDFVVHPRGEGPWDGTVAHRVVVLDERESVAASDLGTVALAVVDEESEITYFDTATPEVAGSTDPDLPPGAAATLFEDRALLWDAPPELYRRGFYGQQLDDDGTALQLSLVEAAHLAGRGAIDVDGGREAVVERGQAAEGERFDRRLAVYDELRSRGVVPKTGFKFGADFRTYADVESVEDLGHSELLVRVVPADREFAPRDLALDVRMAHGVRKRMVYALVDDGVEWVAVERLTP